MFNPSRSRIIAIGKIRKQWINDGINSYLKRLPGLSILQIKDSNLKKESQIILSSIKKYEIPIILGEEYDSFSSIEFAKYLSDFGNNQLVFILGGSEGLSSDIKKISSWKLSLSPLTFPHELAQLLLVEQIYRAKSILEGSPYHRK